MYSVYLDFGLGWEELIKSGISLVLDNTIQKTQTLHKDLKPTANTARFTIAGDADYINRLLGYNLDIPARIMDDSSAWFVGFIRSNLSTSVKYSIDKINLEIVDSSFRLKKKNDTYFFLENYTLSDPSNKSISIMHQLFYLAGFDDSELDFPLIDKTIPVITDTGDQTNTIEKYVNQLCLEFGYVWNFNDGGFCNLEKVIITDTILVSTVNIDNDTGDMSGELTIDKRRGKKGGCRVTFRELEEIEDAVVFSDTTGGSGADLANIDVSGNYPEESESQTVYCDFRPPDGAPEGSRLISAKNSSLDWAQVIGGGLSLDTFSPEATRAELHISGYGTITRLRIIADAIIATDYIIKASLISAITEEEAEEISANYINSETDAEELANARRLFWEFSDIEYSCLSDLGSLGEIARFQEVSRTGIDMLARIYRIDYQQSGKRKIYLEAVEEYTASSVNQGIKFSGSSPESSQLIEIAVASQEYADAIQDAVTTYVDSIALAIESAKQDAVVNGKTIIVNGYLNTDFISAGVIVAGLIAANAITAEKIDTGAVTSEKIDTGAITADKIAAGAISADNIDVDDLFTNVITVGALNGELRSTGFVSESTGWRIQGNGDIEANNLKARGVISAGGTRLEALVPWHSEPTLQILRYLTTHDYSIMSTIIDSFSDPFGRNLPYSGGFCALPDGDYAITDYDSVAVIKITNGFSSTIKQTLTFDSEYAYISDLAFDGTNLLFVRRPLSSVLELCICDGISTTVTQVIQLPIDTGNGASICFDGSDLIMLEASSNVIKKMDGMSGTVKSTLNIDIANSTGIEWDGINFLIVDATGSINAYRGFSTDLLYTINFSTQIYYIAFNGLNLVASFYGGTFRRLGKRWD